jgi:hypothetical protein
MVKSLINKKFGYLTVIKQSSEYSKNRTAKWDCLCDCGNIITVDGSWLNAGRKIDCGCHRLNASERFNKKINKQPNGCWLYTGAIKPDGYGVFSDENRKNVYAHRFSYMMTFGEIPSGLVIDHKCRNRACVNPEHLEAVTQLENLLRGKNEHFVAHVTKICKRGHPQNETTTTFRCDGRRQCKICQSIRRAAIKKPL